jgi:hypothetical protein
MVAGSQGAPTALAAVARTTVDRTRSPSRTRAIVEISPAALRATPELGASKGWIPAIDPVGARPSGPARRPRGASRCRSSSPSR